MQPAFAVNAVLPDLVFGPIVNPAPGSYSSGTWLIDLFNGKIEGNPITSFMNPAAWVVDVRDVAALHVAAALASDVNSERLWASSEPGRLNELLRALRDAYPGRTIVPDFEWPVQPTVTQDVSRSTELLRRYAGRSWISAKQSVVDTVRSQM
jgi:nucleoside-diphosphate-sugar epimerase